MQILIQDAEYRRGFMRLECAKCTCFADFPAATQALAVEAANRKGWRKRGSAVICPRCPGGDSRLSDKYPVPVETHA